MSDLWHIFFSQIKDILASGIYSDLSKGSSAETDKQREPCSRVIAWDEIRYQRLSTDDSVTDNGHRLCHPELPATCVVLKLTGLSNSVSVRMCHT